MILNVSLKNKSIIEDEPLVREKGLAVLARGELSDKQGGFLSSLCSLFGRGKTALILWLIFLVVFP